MSRQGQTCIPGTLSGNVHGRSQLVVHYLPQPLGGWACSHMDGLDPASVPRHLQVSNFAGDIAALHHKAKHTSKPGVGEEGTEGGQVRSCS